MPFLSQKPTQHLSSWNLESREEGSVCSLPAWLLYPAAKVGGIFSRKVSQSSFSRAIEKQESVLFGTLLTNSS